MNQQSKMKEPNFKIKSWSEAWGDGKTTAKHSYMEF